MRLLVYEYVTGGGWWGEDPLAPPRGGLLAEGFAMLGAVAGDFLAGDSLAGKGEVRVLRDARLPEFALPGVLQIPVHSAEQELSELQRAAARAEGTLLIAPEWNGELSRRARLVLEAGGRLISPGPELIELAADKHRAAEWLRAHGVPAPEGMLLEASAPLPAEFPLPAVLKPVDGAGSLNVRLLQTAHELRVRDQTKRLGAPSAPCAGPRSQAAEHCLRLERYYSGLAASVAAICGPAGHLILPACSQRLSDDGCFSYLGGSTPLARDLNLRARRLAKAALEALPPAVGYIGFDLVLGGDPSGEQDVVIEINPRLTTSYVGLRALCRENLATAMLRAALGEPVELSFLPGPIEFRANGELAQ